MIKTEIRCFSDFVSVALSVDDADFAKWEMKQFRRFSPMLFYEFRARFRKEQAEREAKGLKHKPSIFD